jgi:hypothetical protein
MGSDAVKMEPAVFYETSNLYRTVTALYTRRGVMLRHRHENLGTNLLPLLFTLKSRIWAECGVS